MFGSVDSGLRRGNILSRMISRKGRSDWLTVDLRTATRREGVDVADERDEVAPSLAII